MDFPSVFRQSVIALKANKLRSFFSILGIVIGVAAVVLILSLGQGLKKLVIGQIEAYGPNMLGIGVKAPGAGEIGTAISAVQGIKITTLKRSDVKDLEDKSRFPYIEAVSGQAFGQEWVAYQNTEKKVLLYGCGADFINVFRTAKINQGRFFTQGEEEGLEKVAVLGNNLADKFFKSANPVGEKIRIKGQNFKIVGTLKPQGGFSLGGIDMNDFIYLPLKTALKEVLGIDYLTEIHLTLEGSGYFSQAKEEISRLLRQNHHIVDPSKDDFSIKTMDEILERVNQTAVILNLFLGFLAAISLLVGGIGIMNIMLVSVSERVREIGLRKALGAAYRDILSQFLLESLLMTGLGGFIGIIIGVSFSLLSGLAIRTQGIVWPLTISWLAIAAAFFVSMAIGLIFGVYPSAKAARLDPIRALKKE